MKKEKKKVQPLNPPVTESELNEASLVWTDAQNIMVARGYGRELWGNQRRCCQEFVVLMMRAIQQPSTPDRV